VLVVVSSSSMDCEQRGASSLNFSRQMECVSLVRKTSYFASHWHFQVLLQLSDHRHNQLRLFEEERAVVSFFSNTLWATKVDIDSIAVIFDVFCSVQEDIGIIGAELDH